MAATTSRGLHAPERADPVEPNVTPGTEAPTDPTDVALLAHQVDGLYLRGPQADRPSPGVDGRVYDAEDTGLVFIDRVTTWIQINGGYITTAAQRALLSPLVYGMPHYASDTGDRSSYLGGGVWSADGSESRLITSPGGASSGPAGTVEVGALNARGPVTWTRVAAGGNANGAAVVGTGGRYRITAKVQVDGLDDPTGTVSLYLGRAGIEIIESRDVRNGTANLGGIELLEDGDGLTLSWVASESVTVALRQLVVERLGW